MMKRKRDQTEPAVTENITINISDSEEEDNQVRDEIPPTNLTAILLFYKFKMPFPLKIMMARQLSIHFMECKQPKFATYISLLAILLLKFSAMKSHWRLIVILWVV